MSPFDAPPHPHVTRRSKASRALPWVVVLAAAAAAGYYGARHLARRGPAVEVVFDDGSGLSEDTQVLRRGVSIGKVVSVGLDDDKQRAVARVRLARDQAAFAREGAVWWVVRPKLSPGGVNGLTALASGPYIEAKPGDGGRKTRFEGLSDEPKPGGLTLWLTAPRLLGLSPGAPVTFRGLEVGDVREVRLAPGGDAAEARAVVWRRYAPLVRAGTKFWWQGGLDVEGGIFKGLSLRLGSLKELGSGGFAFATPEKDAGAAAADGARFTVEDKPKKEWLSWAPKLPVEPAASPEPKAAPLPTGQDLKERQSRGK